MNDVVDYWEICYIAKYKTGQLVDKDSPFTIANVVAKDKIAAIETLMMEFPMYDIDIKSAKMLQTSFV